MAGSSVSERRMHVVRWLLTTGWLLIIGSLLFDPFTARFTAPDHPWSPLRLPGICVEVQGRCLVETPYPLGTTLFWGAVVPAAIFLLLVFGHELWRRICPLSFLSQIPRALGQQRQTARRNPKTGEIRKQLAKVPSDSWLARHYPALQFAWLFVGLCGRLLFFNADRLVLFGWLLFTIVAAIAMGWLYGGKAWCQYFCPMAPVQSIYSTPAGLLGSKAHQSSTPITQSMCRTTKPSGEEQSACVACQQPCIDIDAERMYWARLGTPAFAFERYGYLGLLVGYFLYYYLYAGNWTYYFSGACARQSDQLSQLLSPGLFVFGQPINIPRIVAVPLVLGLCTWLGWLGGRAVEAWSRRQVRRQGAEPDTQQIRHRVALAATFLAFNIFFLFAGRPLLLLAPTWVQYLFDVALVATSTLWLVRNWHRNPALYERENLAERFRRQLHKLGLDVGRFLEGRTLGDLNPDEVFVLARVLPGFGNSQRHEAYKGVVREAMEEGYVNAASSLEVLRRMRQELGISDDEHRQLLEELGVEDPALLDPDRKRSLEDQVRLSGYRRSLERVLRLQGQVAAGSGGGGAGVNAQALAALRLEYGITPGEEARTLDTFSATEEATHRAETLLGRMEELRSVTASLQHPMLASQPLLVALLEEQLRHREELGVRAILECLSALGTDPAAPRLATRLHTLCPGVLAEVLQAGSWMDRLPGPVWHAVHSPDADTPASVPPLPREAVLQKLEGLVRDPLPMVAAAAAALSISVDPARGPLMALALAGVERPAWVRQTAERLGPISGALKLSDLPELEKRVVLATS
ncbi:MAG: cyclic nucleotide-binding protein, partial [Cyanobacteriota bacterium]|nr:cyclic nucleotide-binding protein [Cyanobacteriota bacterium]